MPFTNLNTERSSGLHLPDCLRTPQTGPQILLGILALLIIGYMPAAHAECSAATGNCVIRGYAPPIQHVINPGTPKIELPPIVRDPLPSVIDKHGNDLDALEQRMLQRNFSSPFSPGSAAGNAAINAINHDLATLRTLRTAENAADRARTALDAADRALRAGRISTDAYRTAKAAADSANTALESARAVSTRATEDAARKVDAAVREESGNPDVPPQQPRRKNNPARAKYAFDVPNPHLWNTTGGLNTIVTDSPDSIAGFTGIMGMTYMDYLGMRNPQYYFKKAGLKYNSQAQIDYYNSLPTTIVAQFGTRPTLYKAGVTQCVYSTLQSLFLLYGGINAVINGIPITDKSFDGFAEAWVGNKRQWIDAIVKRNMGIEIKDKSKIRTGDLVQQGNHRYWVGDTRYKDGKLQLLRLEASPYYENRSLPKNDPLWQVRNAIKMNRWVDASKISGAVRLFDVTPARLARQGGSINPLRLKSHGIPGQYVSQGARSYGQLPINFSTGNSLHQAAYKQNTATHPQDVISNYEQGTFRAAGNMALSEYKLAHLINLKGLPDAYITTIGALRDLLPEYSYNYAETYITWYYESFKHRHEGAKPPPVLAIGKGASVVQKQLAILRTALDALGYLKYVVGNKIFANFTSLMLDTRVRGATDYTDALNRLIAEKYHVEPPSAGYRDSFYMALDMADKLDAGGYAIIDYEKRHRLRIGANRPLQVYTLGSLVLLPSRHARPYPDVYLSWIAYSDKVGVLPLPPEFGPQEFQVNGTADDSMQKLLRTLELTYWLTSKMGDKAYYPISKIVSAASRQSSYEAYTYTLASEVRKQLGISFPGWDTLQALLDRAADPGDLYYEQHLAD